MWNASSRLRFFLPINCEKLNRANEIFKHIRIFIFFSKDGWSITRGSKRSGRKVGKMDSERTRKYEKESSKKSVRRIVPNNVTRNIYYAISWKRISICHRRINESERSREGERIYRNWRWIRSSVIDTLDILSRGHSFRTSSRYRSHNAGNSAPSSSLPSLFIRLSQTWNFGQILGEIRVGGTSGRVIRGAPWGSPRQASPTNNRRRGRSRPADWARSRSVWAGRSVEPRCSIRAYASSRSRSSSSVVRSPPFDGNGDSEPAEHPCPRIDDNTCQFYPSCHPHLEETLPSTFLRRPRQHDRTRYISTYIKRYNRIYVSSVFFSKQ